MKVMLPADLHKTPGCSCLVRIPLYFFHSAVIALCDEHIGGCVLPLFGALPDMIESIGFVALNIAS